MQFVDFAITKPDNPINKCSFLIEDDVDGRYEFRPADSILKECSNSMKWTHLICFFLISLAEWISRDDLDAHYQVFFNITSVLCYQTTIIGVWLYQHCIPDKIKAQENDLPEIKDCIVDENFGSAREWLVYESMAYFV